MRRGVACLLLLGFVAIALAVAGPKASKAGRFISADDSLVTGKINYSYYVNALAGLKLDVLP